MHPDVSHYLAAFVILLVFGVGVDRIVWKPRRPSLTWQMKGLQVAWIAAVFCACAVALCGFDLRVVPVTGALGGIAGLVEAVSWTRLLPRRSAHTPTS